MLTAAKTILTVLLVVLLFAMAVEGVPASLHRGVASIPAHSAVSQAAAERPDVERIVSVLEQKMGSHRFPGQAREKLEAMPDQDLRLVASLCDRLAVAHDRAGTDLALLVAAVLIILS